MGVFSRLIAGWHESSSLHSGPRPRGTRSGALGTGSWRGIGPFAHARPLALGPRGAIPSVRYTERLAAAGAVTSVGSRGDSQDNAIADSVIGLYKAELMHRRGPWRGLSDLELATLEWVDWFNNRRLFSAIGYVPPAEYEANHVLSESKGCYSSPVPAPAGTQQTESP